MKSLTHIAARSSPIVKNSQQKGAFEPKTPQHCPIFG